MVVGDIGTVIELDTGVNVSAALSAKIRYSKPSGTRGEWTASVSGNKVTYTTIDGDIDQSGDWSLQAYLDLNTWEGSSTIALVPVGKRL